ncbi:TIR domain-containing protein [Rhizobium leguminosarum bv. viciae]|uniref:toll/interleukin-1 receptor domain-containing protein n=1 Tax=Rhizobium leguminosarum TaxID=384 RepID=UPI001442614E|nr:toll/interleukin-1 receptor domain-containing protein [Rhizobium leguminosarum]NKK67408.1 TIR domain-containing protein [Rhizobium leguminosarum bv. viciae]
MSDPVRDVVFISHATPEDNDFVKWLGARLIGLGYDVWADVFELKGGTPFWKNIEEAIRQRALKVIYVASTASVNPNRKGVRDELAAADGMGKKLKDTEFIIPVRIDKVDFNDFPIPVLQLNALDFSSGWGGMLPKLLETLEKASVPTNSAHVDERMAFWMERTSRDIPKVEVGSELLLTNLLSIQEFPKQISFYEFNGPNTEIKAAMDCTGIPYVRFARLIISFADITELQLKMPPQFTLSLDKRINLKDFLQGPKRGETGPEWREARKILSNLVRRHVERFLADKGLKVFERSSGSAFYFPLDLVEGGKVSYTKPDGGQARKAITGRSEKYKVHWHLAMMVNIDIGPPAFIRFKPYICFSENGTLITDPKRTSAIRRRFCKTWWNRQWRQLLQAFITFLSNGDDEIVIAFDGPEQLEVGGKLWQVEGVRRLVNDIELHDLPEDPEEPLDDPDDDHDIDSIDVDEEDAA